MPVESASTSFSDLGVWSKVILLHCSALQCSVATCHSSTIPGMSLTLVLIKLEMKGFVFMKLVEQHQSNKPCLVCWKPAKYTFCGQAHLANECLFQDFFSQPGANFVVSECVYVREVSQNNFWLWMKISTNQAYVLPTRCTALKGKRDRLPCLSCGAFYHNKCP